MASKYRFIDLFCGIGGFRLALERLGAKCVFSSDIDVFAQQTYFDNFSEKPLGDITQIEAKDIPSFDILTAGFPCQPFSYAGYVCLGDIILYFDDCGIANKDKKLIEYNCNIPSNNPKFQNQLFGNICAIKFENMGRENEKAIDLCEKDFDELCNMFFEVSKEEIYSSEKVSAYFTNFFR